MVLLSLSRLMFAFSPVVLVAAVAGCVDAPTAPSSYSPFTATDLREGTGATVAVGSVATVHYTGWLYDGSRPDQKGAQIDSSAAFGPYTFLVGFGQVIRGWDEGVLGMAEGGLRRLVVPPSLAYGPTRNGIIPPYATLVFEIELLEVQ